MSSSSSLVNALLYRRCCRLLLHPSILLTFLLSSAPSRNSSLLSCHVDPIDNSSSVVRQASKLKPSRVCRPSDRFFFFVNSCRSYRQCLLVHGSSIQSTSLSSSSQQHFVLLLHSSRCDPTCGSLLLSATHATCSFHRHAAANLPIPSLSPFTGLLSKHRSFSIASINDLHLRIVPSIRSFCTATNSNPRCFDLLSSSIITCRVDDLLSTSSPSRRIISIKCWMINIEETCLFDETVQFNRNYKHCYSAASCGCGIF